MIDLDLIFDDDRQPTTAVVDPPAGIVSPDDLPTGWAIEWLERASIREYDGRQSRAAADRDAFREILARMRTAGEKC